MLVSRTATMLRAVPSRMRTGGAGPRLASSHASPSLRPKPCARAVQSSFRLGPGASPSSPSSPIMSTVTLLSRARAASTTPTPAPTSAPGPTGNDRAMDTPGPTRAPRPAGDDGTMDWNTFFKLRKQRRRLQLAFSTVACLGGGTAGAIFLSTGALDRVVAQFPLDPFITLGLMTFSAAALGWLLGPIIGTTVFYMFKRSIQKEMTKKEVQFFARIKKNRVDPSSASASNPVPDFYGEKIQSVAGYRQWLKDQRVFRKKRTTFI